MKKPKKIEIVTIYPDHDPECVGDYESVEVEFDGKVVIRFGDYYHEKGDVRADAFVRGVQYALGLSLKVTERNECSPSDD